MQNSLEKLEADLAIHHRRHHTYPNLVSLNYDQLDSPDKHPIVIECRGIILDENRNWEVVSRPFDRFFNEGQDGAATIDWSNAQVYEKLDGSLMQLYFYDNQWQVATRGTPDASGPVSGYTFTFKELFWKIWKNSYYELPEKGWEKWTFLFELTSPYNKVVVPYKDEKITLIGARCIVDDQEVTDLYTFCGFNWELAHQFDLTNFDSIVATFQNFDPTSQEGYVIRSNSGQKGIYNRVKLKHPGYAALSHLKEGCGIRRLLEIIRSGEHGEFLTYFPEYKEQFELIQEKYNNLVDELTKAYEYLSTMKPPDGVQLMGKAEQKFFAMEAIKYRCHSCLFALRTGRAKSVKHYLAEIHINQLMKALDLAIEPNLLKVSI